MAVPIIGKNLEKLATKTFSSEDERKAFLNCFTDLPTRDASLLWLKEPQTICPVLSAFSFQPPWVQRIGDYSAGSHPLHEEGAFYILDSSSIFAVAPALQILKLDLIFDACAAPGGKSITAWRAHHPNLIIANEFVEKRLKPLISNLQRCQIRPAEVFHLPTKRIGQMFPSAFPLVMVDAPCSGQSLLLKGEKVDGAFHPQTVNGNAMRQRRILAELAPSVIPGGHFLYMTCTFSPEENEDIIEWFLKKFKNFESVAVPALAQYQSQLTDARCYRLWPQQKMGAGSFTALLRNKDEGDAEGLPENYKPVWINQ